MADIEISYNNSVIATLNDSRTEVLETNNTRLIDDITITYTKSGGPMQLELIGQTTILLPEYTNTTTEEQTDTGINISNTDYAYGFIVITCDSAITTSTEWGMTIANFGRYTSNNALMWGMAIQQKGSATLSKAAMATNSLLQNSYGVFIPNNKANVFVSRKCHATACPKCRAGNYSIAVYGVKSL